MIGNDPLAVTELGFYMRNCWRSPAVARFERLLLERVNRLKGVCEDDDDDIDLSTAPRRARIRRVAQDLLNARDFAFPAAGPLIRNAGFARRQFGLDRIEVEILLLLMRAERNSELKSLIGELEGKIRLTADLVAILLREDARAVEKRMRPDATLAAGGLVRVDRAEHGLGICGFLRLSGSIRRTLDRRFRSHAQWVAALAGARQLPELAWDDFGHLGEAAGLARQVIAAALRQRQTGINILLHGPVGTGKTEFCKVLAAETAVPLWAVAEEDDESNEPQRCERLASLRLLQRLFGARCESLILFDEAEDLLEQPGALFGERLAERSGSKVHINRLLETNPVPVLWTCNEVHSIDPAVLRRMTMAIEIKTPGVPARMRIWGRALARAKVSLDEPAIGRLARHYAAPAAVAANAARVAALAEGGEAEIEKALSGVLRLLHLPPHPRGPGDLVFDPAFVRCDEDVCALAETLARPGASLNWSLCLSGPPGTGKSEYARYLARRIGLETMQRRASDLLSMWVGESEKQIAGAFAEARDGGAMLILDEADSLLSDRRGAVRSWEVTQVNEMLTWMEQHPLPFVCTTNLAERLDQASLRRFTLKLRFEPLARPQAERLFAHAFGTDAPCALPDALTPGDFATVKRRASLFGETAPARLVEWLAQEAAARGAPIRRIGFGG